MASSVLPLKAPRLGLLFLTWCFGVIGGSVGLNAVVKRNIQVANTQALVAASGIVVNIDTSSLLNPGIVLTVGCTVLAIVASIWLGLLLLDMRKSASAVSKEPISTRTLPLQWMSLAFMAVWIFACAVPATLTAVNGEAKVTAFSRGAQLPDALVAATERSLGVDPAYWSNDFVRLQTIPPWIALGFAIITTIVTFVASGKRQPNEYHLNREGTPDAVSHVEKTHVVEKEEV
ncbi:hypothetical protein M408DRAFT_326733 [Serendipita vermifera MAFF 305830]|uniref:Transmembrane protein n=1 Tax=Serendipita vermifera MAFF 305830 TaxID=933852 RepID=A0A0C2X4M3_SERVB|nr:hypothetical protein M408DRAFT_326733 [Serendipita vermifera MAFF 305830]